MISTSYSTSVTQDDPFTSGQPQRLALAKWVADIWQRFNVQPGAHLRRVHYLLVSQEPPLMMPPRHAGGMAQSHGHRAVSQHRRAHGDLQINVFIGRLSNQASCDARYEGLIDAADLIDRRNEEPIIYLPFP